MEPDLDMTPRYTPEKVMIVRGNTHGRMSVLSAHFYPAGTAVKNCPIKLDSNVLELRTAVGSRWYGCKSASINSELRMVITGFPAKFEEMAAWEVCKTK